MDKREKVIKGLECCVDEIGISHAGCPYYTDGNKNCGGGEPFPTPLLRDALELLKAQEPVPAENEHMEMGLLFSECGYCYNAIRRPWRFCPFCGRPVKWE